MLQPGDRLPDFHARETNGDDFLLSHDAGGMPVVLVVGAIVSLDVPALVIHIGHPADEHVGIAIVDHDGSLATALVGGSEGVVVAGRDHRVVAAGPVDDLDDLLASLPDRGPTTTVRRTVPLLTVDDLFEPALCRSLISHMASQTAVPSPSFVDDADGSGSVLQVDDTLKVRFDLQLDDPALLTTVVDRLQRRLLPEVARGLAHRPSSFEAPKLVRYPSGGGFFAAHRDNTTADCAHRRLAVTINLDDEHVGGELRFPELGDEIYRPRAGAAIVFSCGLLHEVVPVTQGARHALITFLW